MREQYPIDSCPNQSDCHPGANVCMTGASGSIARARSISATDSRDLRSDHIGPHRKVYLDAGFTNLAESTVGLSSTFSTYVVMLSAGLTPTTRTM